MTLIALVVGLMLSQQYTVDKSIRISASAEEIASLVSDFNQWPEWQPWQAVDPSIEFIIAEPSQGVGAHQFWQSRFGKGEMTITQLNKNAMMFNILFNQEHIAKGEIRFSNAADGVEVRCTLQGEVNTPIIGGYLALLSQYILNNSVKLALNNIKTYAQLATTEKAIATDDSQSGSSEN
ncbi:SRPBCC family protein [Pseudoalteromonas sp. bablab_jr004]|uniref:SRPBCC family protein n=1 Tax=Pseudoalteromonas sp. bablab_jr004 TaxID=2755065 RepID=UPI0018F47E9E|nr:SRPBCC family protein [Pseudoalteromonas sp. bablab_jr004]